MALPDKRVCVHAVLIGVQLIRKSMHDRLNFQCLAFRGVKYPSVCHLIERLRKKCKVESTETCGLAQILRKGSGLGSSLNQNSFQH